MLIDNKLSVKDGLLLHKNIEPLDENSLKELIEIERLDVTKFTEADVRGEIIDPIIRILGYKKGRFSSVDREKHIGFLDKKNRYIDYSITVWQENFWLIEAKKPLKGDRFGYDELSQVVEYSIHPEINAAIVVLCDGVKFEVFDREDDLNNPVLSFKIINLVDNFNSLRKILLPINVWFFYKRRVLKAIDKAFEMEFNISRLNEFKEIIERRLMEKRNMILKNYQSIDITRKDSIGKFENMGVDDIICGYYFFNQTLPTINAMNKRLVGYCINSFDFHVISKMFPDEIEVTSDAYYTNAIDFLIRLEREKSHLGFQPGWLVHNGNSSVESCIKVIIKHLLSFFENDESRRVVILAGAAFRRVYKLLSVLGPEAKLRGELQHLITRFNESEFSWSQILTSPKRNMLAELNPLTIIATESFVKSFTTEKRNFNIELAKQRLKQIWHLEMNILKNTPNYLKLLQEHNFGDMHPTECSAITYDNLGHSALCVIKNSDKWKRYVLEYHKKDLLTLYKLGSWAAKGLIDSEGEGTDVESIEVDLSKRFFFDDEDVYKTLSGYYGLVHIK